MGVKGRRGTKGGGEVRQGTPIHQLSSDHTELKSCLPSSGGGEGARKGVSE